TEPERAAFQRLEEAGLEEVTRRFTEKDRWTYYDYKSMRFQKDEGMRIDFHMASASLAEKVTGAGLDRKSVVRKAAPITCCSGQILTFLISTPFGNTHL